MTESTTARLGTISREGDSVVLRYTRDLAHPPEKVWRAITESEHLKAWFPADIIGQRVEGASLRIAFWPEAIEQAGDEIEASGLDLDDAVLPGTLLTWDPPRVFAFTWDSEHLTFELAPTDAGTRLAVTVRATEPGPRGFASTATGYHVCLDALVASLDGDDADIFDATRIEELEAAYGRLV
ncbi:activator of Hsp90 ATPase-like protein [Mumia flava]|uniref:Activator of Hsp90 ATPase-like protein n=1 Tax=Mumia flava TaxID=1348852 RepID=A0A2M9B778_9ACTN|nr:SRPBCC domain-containing protein [Mumia flava]PJJ53801.1 activator of Hsp90 ATPase-like protein [Mumia flava]